MPRSLSSYWNVTEKAGLCGMAESSFRYAINYSMCHRSTLLILNQLGLRKEAERAKQTSSTIEKSLQLKRRQIPTFKKMCGDIFPAESLESDIDQVLSALRSIH